MAGLFSKLFGGGGGKPAKPSETSVEIYDGFEITAMPEKATGGWRIGARIEKSVGGELRSHHLIRADVIQDREGAEAASVAKAKQMIDEQGDRLFQ